ncbi:hypothetical protein OH76DRAFT_481402 [Lentinus brumalis]|uniref:Uncharacterized protein n=1 Tax=Lentinus brumalis TaxID=2498619 RepID=A0A371DC62_9APHY|nr:hypothetical protein OH76DRAFT_481402 [Polyporus brumalis]
MHHLPQARRWPRPRPRPRGPKGSVAPSRCFRKLTLTGLQLPCCGLRLRRSCISQMAISGVHHQCISQRKARSRQPVLVNMCVNDSGIDSSGGSMVVAQQLEPCGADGQLTAPAAPSESAAIVASMQASCRLSLRGSHTSHGFV